MTDELPAVPPASLQAAATEAQQPSQPAAPALTDMEKYGYQPLKAGSALPGPPKPTAEQRQVARLQQQLQEQRAALQKQQQLHQRVLAGSLPVKDGGRAIADAIARLKETVSGLEVGCAAAGCCADGAAVRVIR